MSDPTREERQQLIEADTGHSATTVYARGSGRDTYHATRECHLIRDPDEYTETTRKQAQARVLKPCRGCIKTLETENESHSPDRYLADALAAAAADAETNGDDPREAALRIVNDHTDT